jgi:hypothetical protein
MKLIYSLLFSSVLLSACTTLVPGTSKEADVLAHFGQPVEQRTLPDGGRILEYPRSPLGFENWRVTLGADGTVRNVEQLLDEPHFARVKPGMTVDQVKLELGRPGEFAKYANLSEEVLSWRYMEFSRRMFFNAHFDMSGRLKYASRSEESLPVDDVGTP